MTQQANYRYPQCGAEFSTQEELQRHGQTAHARR